MTPFSQQHRTSPIGRTGGNPLPALFMSDATMNDITSSSDEEMAMEVDALTPDLLASPTTTTTATTKLGDQMAQKFRDIDVNQVLNTSLLVLLSAAILFKLTMVDAGMTRGWSVEEIAARVATDNWNGYNHILAANPIATKAATSATVYTIGDVIAQKSAGETLGSLDRPRILRSALAGFIGHGPMSHFWYQISENLFTNVLHLTQWWSFVPKIAIDQFFWGPIWNNSYLLLLGLMKRESIESIWDDMKRSTVPLVVSGLKLWPLAHCVTYGLIPVENRLLWVDMVEIFWVTILATQAADHGGGEAEAEVVKGTPPALASATNK